MNLTFIDPKNIYCLTFCLIISTSLVFAQNKTLERNLEPAIIVGNCPEFVGVPVGELNNELFLYAYRADQQIWQQIPFQIDERAVTGNGYSYFIPEDGKFDADDEIVFMAKDAGDRDVGSWIDDVSSQGFVRYEIKITDPTNPGKLAWVYLYRSSTLTLNPDLTDYIDYFKSTNRNMAQDRIQSKFYELDNSPNGFPMNITIPTSAGGNSVDYLDVFKFRALITNIPFAGDENISEQNIRFYTSRDDIVRAKEGRVRVIREFEATIYIDLPWYIGDQYIPFSVPPSFYYPYSTQIILKIPSISTASISTGRMSFDLDARVVNGNTKILSAKNPEPGFVVDGNAEVLDTNLEGILPDSNWVYINGDHGTLVNLFPMAPDIGQQRKLYYKDSSASDSKDTGDRKSYGDTGVDISGGINTPFSMSYKGYFLSKDSSSSIGAKMAHYEKNPLQLDAFPQDYGSVPVELVSFTAIVEAQNVHLAWITATETNNYGFDIERSDSKENDWSRIAFISGKGTATNPVHYEYVDHNLNSGDYDYRLKQINIDGTFEYSEALTTVVGLPQTFTLSQNYPNPFNPSTEIQYQLPDNQKNITGTARTILKIYNLLGREIKTIVDKEQEPGFYTVSWDGHDSSGRSAPSGVYIYRLQFGHLVDTKKMVLVR